jgi:hypothetical protein
MGNGRHTGMIITSEKIVGKDIIKTHEFDAALSREKQIAIELKQWGERAVHKFDPVECLRTATQEELVAALPAVRVARERLRLPPFKPN